MSCSPTADIVVTRGATDPAVTWRFRGSDGVLLDLTGSAFRLEVAWPSLARIGGGSAIPADRFTRGLMPDGASDGSRVVDPLAGTVT